MTVIACIPHPRADFSNIPDTELEVIQVFGRETIVDPDSKSVDVLCTGISCILDTDMETLIKHHPDAWVTNNPLLGQWVRVS